MNAPSEISRTPARAHIEASSALADAVAPLGLADSRYPIVDRERVLSLAALTVVACMLAATIIVMRGGYPPVFNQSPRQYAMLNMGLLASLAISAVILSVHVGLGRWPHAAKILKILLVAALTANLSFGLLERFVVGIDGAKLIHNFHNRVVDGHPLPLQQSNSYSEFGFRTDRVEPKQPSSFRYLMLGNSYTKGSGSSLATNYPQVTERAVNESGDGMKASVFAGGVDGYGLEEADRLFSLLSTDGYKFDAVILNLMMGSDLTNDIPGTMRLATAGEPQRYHRNSFLFYAYPLNTYLFRYLLYFKITAGMRGDAPAAGAAAPGSPAPGCSMSDGYKQFVRDRALQYYGPGARDRVYLAYNLGFADDIIARAAAMGLKTYIVLQPDPNAELDSRRTIVSDATMDWDWTRTALKQHFGDKTPLLDLGPSFRNRDDLFRCNDTHWNDSGNILAGEITGRWLEKALR